MTYWWNEIGDRISLFNLADICPKAWFFLALLFFSIGFRDF